MIAIKEKDAIYFASPMQYQNFFSQLKLDYGFEENGDIWHLKDGHGTIVMVDASNARATDILRYSDAFDCDFTKSGMHRLYDNVVRLLGGTNCIVDDGNTHVSLCVARGNKGYRVSCTGAVFEIGELDCFNENYEQVAVIYEHNKHIPDVYERIRAVYDLLSEYSGNKYYPIAVVNTKDDSYTLLTN